MKDTLKWFQIAKPNPTESDAQCQIGVHTEEFLEMFTEGLGFEGASSLSEELASTSDYYKRREDRAFTEDLNRLAMLDSLADQYVTLIGVAHTLGMDIEGAVKEVEASNLSKYVHVGIGDISDLEWMDLDAQVREIEAQGRYKGVYWSRKGEYVVFYDDNGKILKSPRTYFEPSLEKFV